MSVTTISSSDLISTEEHFRVSAGPGAGKTYWLGEHIKHILSDSTRLGKTKKVACITYTNVAVETIKSQLGVDARNVEVSTIHSFLYRYIVKPFLTFIDPALGLNIIKVDGHDDHIPSTAKLINWINEHPQKSSLKHPFSENQLTKLPDNITKLRRWLGHLTYQFNASSGEVSLYLNDLKGYQSKLNKPTVAALKKDLLSYKQQYWSQGILHHDDVLFFSHHLIERYPFLLDVVRTRFPYFLVDEFQDTSPIQAYLLSLIGQAETVVGIIGDECQSIYGFTGADFYQHRNFILPGIRDFIIRDNRRSTDSIIELLNQMRPSMSQNGLRETVGSKPFILVGSAVSCFQEAGRRSSGVEICSLAYKNFTTNALKNEVEPSSASENIFQDMAKLDSNSDRKKCIKYLVQAIVHARELRFSDALKLTKKLGLNKKDGLYAIKSLLDNYECYCDKPISDFYSKIQELRLPLSLSKLRNGKAKKFYDDTTFTRISLCVDLIENESLFRTVHKAKGAEFPAVFIMLRKETDLEVIYSPNLDTEEEHRVYYVGTSRAEDLLFISVPELSAEAETKIGCSVQVIRL